VIRRRARVLRTNPFSWARVPRANDGHRGADGDETPPLRLTAKGRIMIRNEHRIDTFFDS
jgi:hypothetical protein